MYTIFICDRIILISAFCVLKLWKQLENLIVAHLIRGGSIIKILVEIGCLMSAAHQGKHQLFQACPLGWYSKIWSHIAYICLPSNLSALLLYQWLHQNLQQPAILILFQSCQNVFSRSENLFQHSDYQHLSYQSQVLQLLFTLIVLHNA